MVVVVVVVVVFMLVVVIVMVVLVVMMGSSERADRSLVCKITRSLRQLVCLHYTTAAIFGKVCQIWATQKFKVHQFWTTQKCSISGPPKSSEEGCNAEML